MIILPQDVQTARLIAGKALESETVTSEDITCALESAYVKPQLTENGWTATGLHVQFAAQTAFEVSLG